MERYKALTISGNLADRLMGGKQGYANLDFSSTHRGDVLIVAKGKINEVRGLIDVVEIKGRKWIFANPRRVIEMPIPNAQEGLWDCWAEDGEIVEYPQNARRWMNLEKLK